MKPKMVIILVIAVLFLIVLVQNAHAVTLSLLFWKVSVSLFLLIFFSVIIGFALGYIACEVMKAKKNFRA